jgi:hypothetical protein
MSSRVNLWRKSVRSHLEEMDAFDKPFEPWCEWLARRVLLGEYRVVPRALNNPYAPRRGFL